MLLAKVEFASLLYSYVYYPDQRKAAFGSQCVIEILCVKVVLLFSHVPLELECGILDKRYTHWNASESPLPSDGKDMAIYKTKTKSMPPVLSSIW